MSTQRTNSANTPACPRVLSIAGTDPTGGAGIQADLKSIGAAGGFGMCATTALVAQNTQGVRSIHTPPMSFLEEQLAAVFDDVTVDAVKIGMLGDAVVTELVQNWLREHPVPIVVIDPVMVATSGDRLLNQEAEDAVRTFVSQCATVVTPNLPELAVLVDQPVAQSFEEALAQAQQLAQQSSVMVLAKGGHLSDERADNALVTPEGAVTEFPVTRVQTKNTHGTGCSLSSALATRLAAGDSPERAVEWSSRWLHEAISHADALQVGQGHGPVDHFHRMRYFARAGSAQPWLREGWDTTTPPASGQQFPESRMPIAGPHTQRLWALVADSVWPEILNVPFIRSLRSGALTRQDFGFYLNQDAMYLREYSRALAALSASAPTAEEQVFWAQSAAGALVEEAEMHRTWLAAEAESEVHVQREAHPSPVTKAYTDHLLASVLGDDYVVGVAAVLPCFWLYAEVGQELHSAATPDHPYATWLDTYKDEDFVEATRRAIELMERALEAAGPQQRIRAEKAFVYASIHEREFFDQASRTW